MTVNPALATTALAPGALAPAEPVPDSAVLEAGAAAITLHAGRPWRVKTVDRGFELRAPGPPRRSGVFESAARELLLSAGAAIFTMRLAVGAGGCRPMTSLLPDPARPGVLAVLRRGAAARPTPEEQALFDALPSTPAGERRPFRPVAVPPLRHLLRRAAETEGAWACGPDAERTARLRAVLRHCAASPRAGAGFAAEWERAGWAEADPPGRAGLLVLVGGYHALPVAELQAGQALQRMLLTATALGLDAAALPAPVHLPEVQRALAGLVGPRLHPQAVLRLRPRAAGPASC